VKQCIRCTLTLSFFTAISIALMFWCETPRLRCRTQKHLRDLDPVITVWARQQRFYQNKIEGTGYLEMPSRLNKSDLPSSLRPLNAGARSLILPGSCSRMPMGIYRYWKESASHRYRRVAFTPVVSDPKWLRNGSQNPQDDREEAKGLLQPVLCILQSQFITLQLRMS